jgi:hypothetical protein
MKYEKETEKKVEKNILAPAIYIFTLIIFYFIYSKLDITTGYSLLDFFIFLVIVILFAFAIQKLLFKIFYKYYS